MVCWSHLLSHTLRERGDCRLKPFISHHPETPRAAIRSPVFKSLLHDVANESILCLTCLRIAPQGRNRSGNPEELLGSLVPSSHCIDGDTAGSARRGPPLSRGVLCCFRSAPPRSGTRGGVEGRKGGGGEAGTSLPAPNAHGIVGSLRPARCRGCWADQVSAGAAHAAGLWGQAPWSRRPPSSVPARRIPFLPWPCRHFHERPSPPPAGVGKPAFRPSRSSPSRQT